MATSSARGSNNEEGYSAQINIHDDCLLSEWSTPTNTNRCEKPYISIKQLNQESKIRKVFPNYKEASSF